MGLVAAPAAAEAQRTGRIPKLCFLTFDPGTAQSPSPRFEAFFQGLRDLGYVDGQTITIDYLSAEGRGERFPALAADCLRLKADIVVVTTTPAAEAAKNATRTIPIVMHSLGDPVLLTLGIFPPRDDLDGLTPIWQRSYSGSYAATGVSWRTVVPSAVRTAVMTVRPAGVTR